MNETTRVEVEEHVSAACYSRRMKANVPSRMEFGITLGVTRIGYAALDRLGGCERPDARSADGARARRDRTIEVGIRGSTQTRTRARAERGFGSLAPALRGRVAA